MTAKTFIPDPVVRANTARASRANSAKAGTSVLRDWDDPNSWSDHVLRQNAQNLVWDCDLGDLSNEQIQRLCEIADGTAQRPEKAK